MPGYKKRWLLISPIFVTLTLELVAMARSLEQKEIKSVIYEQIPTIRWKFGENRSSRSWVLFAQRFIFKKKKKLTEAEHSPRGMHAVRAK